MQNSFSQLLDIQEVDIQIDGMIKLRGKLPEEVEVLVQEIQLLVEQQAQQKALLENLEKDIDEKKVFIKQVEQKIIKYKAHQMEVRNNREYEAITKELELHDLDVQLAHKFLATAYQQIEQIEIDLASLAQLLKTKEDHLVLKKSELHAILAQTQKKEEMLMEQRKAIVSSLDHQLHQTYERIRCHVSNHLVVVPVKKGACGGCCIVIPPYQRLLVHAHNKLVYCEHCGRMLVAAPANDEMP